MSSTVAGRWRSPVLRVALAATAVVTAVYIAVCITVLLMVSRNLTADVDSRLNATVQRFNGPGGRGDPRGFIEPPGTAARFGPPLLIWSVSADGVVTSPTSTTDLPIEATSATEPRTVSIVGSDVRVAGVKFGGGKIIIGQEMDSVTSAQHSVLRTEIGIAPVLLGSVFIGAWMVGRRATAPIERARRLQTEFTADASHELRTPLSVIEAQANLAVTAEHPVEWYRDAFTRVDTEARRMHRLVDDMLWLARFDTTRGNPHAEPVDAGVLMQTAVDRFSAVAEARSITLRAVVDGDGLAIEAAPDWLDRLAGVLLDNACRHAPDGGEVRATVSRSGARVTVAIEDSGPGIPEAERERIFDRFHRAGDAPGGAGLGLAIGDAVVQATGGRWEISTSSLGGARVAVTWPAASIPQTA